MPKSTGKAHQMFPHLSRSKPRSPLEEPASETSSKRDAKHGLFVLVDKPPEQGDGIDIVAVHGLNGHYSKIWTAEPPNPDRRRNWLQEDLPQTVPSARIMSFGYDSAVFSKSVADIGDFAELLLQELLAKRGQPGEQTRPLLFLCHSLGGIVLKKVPYNFVQVTFLTCCSICMMLIMLSLYALVRANERNFYKEILSCVQGVAFLGTPHQGSEAANWAQILANMLDVMSFNSNMNTALLENLQEQSDVLFKISESFVDRCDKLQIVSFYETRELSGTNVVVVPKKSALLLRSNETPVPLNADHRSLCRFPNTEEDQGRLELVLSNLKYLGNEMVSKDEKKVMLRLSIAEKNMALQQLYPGDYESFKDFNVTRTPGTCEWLLKHNQYEEWRHGRRQYVSLGDAAAGQALTIEEMGVILAVKRSHRTLEDVEADIQHPQEDYIKALCGHFVRFIDGKIYYVHQTARKFLLSRASENSVTGDTWQHTITLAESNKALFQTCATYMICGDRSGWDAAPRKREAEHVYESCNDAETIPPQNSPRPSFKRSVYRKVFQQFVYNDHKPLFPPGE
ncbi:uncharacterized protein F4812DRAFT_470599 [Daldinia caldariorum]|uniref:uncharacterized protein n=1 Tax=Daldinia caldariorum TaxID=326644 RepID=UPI00200720E9|nr:uncharacterized protein F4812DRAFT_470599 [Daldinia caldariorum]KAI1468752.1 hypothetical protein F4812DRAFT_470599 [Daldinia caldariorum]